MKMKALAALAVLTATTMLVGCSDSNETSSPSDSSKPVTLNAWIMPNSPQPDKDFLTLLKPYLDQHPNVKINVTVLDWNSAWTKITAAATSGTGPDILQLGTTWVPAIAAMGGIEEVTDKVNDVGGASAWAPASWATTQIAGKPNVYGVPWFIDARAIFYRTDAFKQAGVDPATAFQSWDSFKAALEKVNGISVDGGKTKMAAMTLPGKNDWNVDHNIFPWVWAAGGEVLSSDNKKAVFNDDKGLQGVLYYTGLAQSGLVDKGALEENTAQTEADWENGKAAVLIDGSYMISTLATTKDKGGAAESPAAKNYAVAPLPPGPSGKAATFFGGSDLTVFSGSQHKADAWDVIKYLSTDDAQLTYAKMTGDLPAKNAVFNNDYFKNDPNLKQFVDAAKNGRSYPSVAQWGPIETVLVKHLGNIWDFVAGVNGTYSQESVKKELDAAASEVDALLKQQQ
ncbi:sugar ABC transporter substrate-binding protein [Tumebacillus flagellatus]|uniref:ABC transporter substrate-binding protein n=1 Tax=Tumebacillus flagellatus TaxID=1157490 RepID=A0A074M6P3_9BACL|nr:sugar ABC transporter substrate-binding protein [Tumebacillus flagellatus]KEO81647.1 ABC transporter substrate-binding protein [Tumebacillus flagellatus]